MDIYWFYFFFTTAFLQSFHCVNKCCTRTRDILILKIPSSYDVFQWNYFVINGKDKYSVLTLVAQK